MNAKSETNPLVAVGVMETQQKGRAVLVDWGSH